MNHQADKVPPARPHQKLTEDGRRMREVLSYSRRGSRFTPTQQEAWDAHAARWVIPDEDVDQPGFDLAERFGRTAPLVVEIGCGVGEATGVLAAARPEHDVLALEVWRPGVAASLAEVAAAGAENVRFCSVDAVWSLEHPAGSRSCGPSSPTRGPRRATTSVVSSSPTSPRWWPRGCDPAVSGAWRPTGRRTPSTWSRRSTPSPLSRAGVWSGGPSAR